ncbi:MAG: molybdopterin-binding protein [Planctomycetota bacterium]
MLAEVIAIGDELVSGQRLDTNSQWLSRQLGDLGIRTLYHSTVGDDLQANMAVFRNAAQRADVIVCTGGLGPTLDDLTRQAIAEAFERELVLDASALEKIEGMFAVRSRPMPERNRVQAMFPEGSQIIDNPHGSAPGIDFRVESSNAVNNRSARIFALPGVPAEMREMWQQTVFPRIEAMLANQLGSLYYRVVKVFGIGESDVEVKLPDLIRRDRNPSVGITVSQATITLRIAGRALGEAAFESLVAPTVTEIEDALGDLVFGRDADELQDVVLREIEGRDASLASLEVGSASWIGDWLLASPHRHHAFTGSLAAPNWRQAGQLLGLEERVPEDGTVDDEILGLMAERLCEQMGCEFGVVVGAYPTQAEMAKANTPFEPVFAVHTGETTTVRRKRMGGHPDVLGPRIGKTGLDLLRRHLGGLPLEL